MVKVSSTPFTSCSLLPLNLEWLIFQLDIKNAFLYSDLHEKVYIKQPLGYISQVENMICKFNKAIYGFKQSSRARFEKFSMVITGISFQRCHYDNSIFVWPTTFGIAFIVICVDDILMMTVSDTWILVEIKNYLKKYKKYFVTKGIVKWRYFLGIEVACQKNRLLLSQEKVYTGYIVRDWSMLLQTCYTSMEVNVDFWNENSKVYGDIK